MQQLRTLPTKPGVYIYKNKKNKIIYVGKAKDLRKRVYSYFAAIPHDAKTSKLVDEIVSIDHIVVGSEFEAFLLEAELIKKHKPYYNIQFRDDKYYPFLKIGKTPYPYVSIVRKRDEKEAKYLGPYISSYDLRIALKLLRRIFPFQSVKNHPKRKCLYYHLGLCPCIPINPGKLDSYKKNIRKIEQFFNGKTDVVLKELKAEQKKAVAYEEFEKAGEIQNQIEKIENLTSEHYAPFSYQDKPDFYYTRIKNELESLQDILFKYGLNVEKLHRIECYDISNTQGTNATGSMVVFIDGDSDKSEYRKFKIKFKKTPDDFAMHMEVMGRRIKNDWPRPDLLVIDGGKGQVSSIQKVLAHYNYNVPMIGLAKREETIVIPIITPGIAGLDFLEVKLPKSTPGINLLRRIRDEAHRFAITYHKLLRQKALNL